MGALEISAIALLLSGATVIVRTTSSLTEKNATLRARVDSLEKRFDVFETGIHKHLDRQDDKLDQIIAQWHRLNVMSNKPSEND